MAERHPAASEQLPAFITAPGETDVLMVVMGAILLLFVLAIGILYFRLHALPEQFAHKKIQFEIVCVLALLAMFTHMHIFWIAALLLAIVDLPDFSTPLNRIAGSAEKIASNAPSQGVSTSSGTKFAGKHVHTVEAGSPPSQVATELKKPISVAERRKKESSEVEP